MDIWFGLSLWFGHFEGGLAAGQMTKTLLDAGIRGVEWWTM